MAGTRLAAAFAVAALVGLGACDGMTPDTTAPDSDAALMAPTFANAGMATTDGSQLATLRRATAKYQRISVAVDEGFFAPDPHCIAAPGLGAMGVHYVHLGRVNDGVADPRAPDVLLYEPMENGEMRLVGVEFVVWRSDWGDPPGPMFLGTEFDHSFGEASHGLPDHYELHIWIWQHNPTGMLAPFNPLVSCP